ncbi:DUF6193 family natural product biosynthesis protein [Streptomyces sp. NPDC087908]|uniref:DUF6193 family natural product biosynthesis protein n=1 Tax=Streptomyces sp. NPDC087908 TaxID=3365820 RepID=UPI003803E20E
MPGTPSPPVVAISPAHGDRPYRVREYPQGDCLVEAATAQEAVALAVARLPAGLGAAVAGAAE